MDYSKMMSGSSILVGDNNVPGVSVPKEVMDILPKIHQACRKMGLEYYPIIVEFVRYDEMAELASYSGFPIRYPHWRWGMEYEELLKGYEHNQYKISEMVINCLDPFAPVLTQDHGTIPAFCVNAGDFVYCNGELRRVLLKKENCGSFRFHAIYFKGVLNEIRSTYNHKWKVLAENGFCWKTSEEIKEGDLLICSDNSNVCNFGQFRASNKVMELLGAIVGANCSIMYRSKIGDSDDSHIVCSVNKYPHNENVVEYIIQLFRKVVGDDLEITETKFSTKLSFRRELLSQEIINSLFHPILAVLHSGMERRKVFFRGLFHPTIRTMNRGLFCVSSGYHKLIGSIQTMLMEMGIYSEVYGGGLYRLFVADEFNQRKLMNIIGYEYDNDSQKDEKLDYKFIQKHHDLIESKYANQLLVKAFASLFSDDEIYNYYKSFVGDSNKLSVLREFVSRVENKVNLTDRLEVNSLRHYQELKEILSYSYVEVISNNEYTATRNVDIALEGGKHDFTAYGVITHNTNPCYIYCMDSNTLVENVNVICHAIGHNDFFKNNVFFAPTHDNMMNKLANHAERIRRYMSRWGEETVIEFIDHVLKIETLVDPKNAWRVRKIKEVKVVDEREHYYPRMIRGTHSYMDEWLNPEEYRKKEQERIKEKESADFLNIKIMDDRDIFAFLKDNAPLKVWQLDIMSMLYDEAMYFYPQRQTKMINEGWASFVDHYLLCREGLVSLGQKEEGCGIIEYAAHKMRVLGGKYSQNPYKLGFELFLDIEDRWNKGKFGPEWENCDDVEKKKNWDLKLNKGLEKCFEVRKYYNDFMMINEFFTRDFCEKMEYFMYRRLKNGEYRIVNRDYEKIKNKLLQRSINAGLPDIRLVSSDFLGRGWLLLKHNWTGLPLYKRYAISTMSSISYLWKNDVVLLTRDSSGEEIVIRYCWHKQSDTDSHRIYKKDEFIKNYINGTMEEMP